MKVYIEYVISWTAFLLRFSNHYLKYFQQAFLTLFSTFPFNILAFSTLLLFIFRVIKKETSQKAMIRLVHEIVMELRMSKDQLEAMTCRKMELSAEIQRIREKLTEGEVLKFDQKLIQDLEKQEQQLYEAYLIELDKEEENFEATELALANEIKDLQNEKENIEKQLKIYNNKHGIVKFLNWLSSKLPLAQPVLN